MKHSENNEIDSLLRKLATRQRAMPAELAKFIGSEFSAMTPHLDADELSSYAEGALPASARARYTSHLADCDDCRQIVTQLSVATGRVIKERSQDSAGTSIWRQILAALFTPAVLRYAMPALALVVVAVAFFAWRQQREASFVALDRHAEVSTTAQPASEATKGNSGFVGDLQNKAEQRPTGAQSSSATTPRTPADKATAKEQKSAVAAVSASSPATATSKERDTPKNEVAVVSQPSYAPEPAPPPPAKPAASTVAKVPARVTGESVESRDAMARRRETEKSSVSGAVAENAPASSKDDRQKMKALGAGHAADDRRADEESETRTVSGRRFQRRKGTWVDTAYNSSVSTISVARGSEQYRALIADEPEIGAIAKQLSGEVILLWKGRAYRIH